MVRIAAVLFVVVSVYGKAFSQRIDNSLSYTRINSDGYLRVCYDNDFFTATDKYYTQGIDIELAGKWASRLPSSQLLLHPFHDYTQYGLGVQHNAYTPTDIARSEILYGDRPFAACLFATGFVISTDFARRQCFSSSLSAGVIGPAAGGMEMQTAIHRWLHDITPHGWPNQLRNDFVLNYQLGYEKEIVAWGRFLSVTANAMARAGTLSDNASAGATMMAGCFQTPLTSKDNQHRLDVYVYDHAAANAVGYDATLQGGLFSRTNPYTIKASELERVTFENSTGIVLRYNHMHVLYGYSFLTREFSTGGSHAWGSLQFAVDF